MMTNMGKWACRPKNPDRWGSRQSCIHMFSISIDSHFTQ